MLAATFGMAMKELPSKEKVSVRDRRGMWFPSILKRCR
jgi:hypothetical protein